MREAFFNGGGADTTEYVWSVTKSVLALTVGVALDRGCLRSLDQTLGELLGPSLVADQEKGVISLRHLLTMSSGIDFPEMASYTSGPSLYQAWVTAPDQAAWVLARPLTAAPGSRFEYGSGTIHLASVALTRACGVRADELADSHLFAPVGVAPRLWEVDHQGHSNGGAGLSLAPRDMQALGHLVLNRGLSQQRQVVSAAFVAAMTSAQISTGAGMATPAYGYAWWVGQTRDGAAFALANGWGGQFILVVPAKRLVVTTAAITTGLGGSALSSVHWAQKNPRNIQGISKAGPRISRRGCLTLFRVEPAAPAGRHRWTDRVSGPTWSPTRGTHCSRNADRGPQGPRGALEAPSRRPFVARWGCGPFVACAATQVHARRHGMSRTWWVAAPVVLVAFVLTPVSASRPGAYDPGQVGPYAVGHTSFVIEDASRTAVFNTFPGPGPGPVPVTIPRPIPVHVFYPVDPSAITEGTPAATYPLDMIYRPTVPAFLTTSAEWEAQGIDRAYQEPTPSANGPFPLVMFSPGWTGPAWAVFYVGTRLASHGFVVAILYHYGDKVWSYEPARDHLNVAALNRPLDVSFALTHLLERTANPGDLLEGVIDPDKVAASGHSLGGYAAMVLAAGDDLVCDKGLGTGGDPPPPSTCVPAMPDPRIRAIAPLDGSTQLLWFNELARITVPTLGIGQEWDQLRVAYGAGWESWQARLHAASQGHPAYRVDLTGTWHITFSNRCEMLPILLARGLVNPASYDVMRQNACGAPLPTPEAHRIVTEYLVAFLKANLAQEAGYQHVLTPGFAITREPMAEFFVTEKRNAQAFAEDWPDEFVYFAHQPGKAKARSPKDPAAALPVPHSGVIDQR